MLALKIHDQAVIIILEDENLRRIKEGEPIRKDKEDIGLNHDVIIAYAKDLKAVKKRIFKDENIRDILENMHKG